MITTASLPENHIRSGERTDVDPRALQPVPSLPLLPVKKVGQMGTREQLELGISLALALGKDELIINLCSLDEYVSNTQKLDEILEEVWVKNYDIDKANEI